MPGCPTGGESTATPGAAGCCVAQAHAGAAARRATLSQRLLPPAESVPFIAVAGGLHTREPPSAAGLPAGSMQGVASVVATPHVVNAIAACCCASCTGASCCCGACACAGCICCTGALTWQLCRWQVLLSCESCCSDSSPRQAAQVGTASVCAAFSGSLLHAPGASPGAASVSN